MFLCLSNALTTVKNYKNRYLEVSGVASPRFFGGQICWLQASNNILFGTSPVKAQNDKICTKIFGGMVPLHPCGYAFAWSKVVYVWRCWFPLWSERHGFFLQFKTHSVNVTIFLICFYADNCHRSFLTNACMDAWLLAKTSCLCFRRIRQGSCICNLMWMELNGVK